MNKKTIFFTGWKNGKPYWNNLVLYFIGIPIFKIDIYDRKWRPKKTLTM